jgi:hypothetical protein
VIRRGAVAALVALLVVACGGVEGGAGSSDSTAQLWVTRDRGSEVLLTATVPAGITVIEALRREADVETRYGGRFVQSIDGVEGSLASQHDWFYFLNGIEPSVGAVEVTLRPGDVAWWDYRSWEGGAPEQPVVVGAFPEPFGNGWSGEPRPVEIRAPAELATEADALRKLLGKPGAHGEPNVFLLEVRDSVRGATLTATRGPADGAPVTFTLEGSLAAVQAAAGALIARPDIVARRYEARFDEAGVVAE